MKRIAMLVVSAALALSACIVAGQPANGATFYVHDIEQTEPVQHTPSGAVVYCEASRRGTFRLETDDGRQYDGQGWRIVGGASNLSATHTTTTRLPTRPRNRLVTWCRSNSDGTETVVTKDGARFRIRNLWVPQITI